MSAKPKTRLQIVNEGRRLLAEIIQTFNDADHWNNSVRKPGEAKIDPDPDGKLGLIKSQIEALLANEIRISEPKHLNS